MSNQQGVSLVEVLVAVLIFSIGILGLAGLQLNSLKFNQTAEIRSHAVFLAYEMADRMRASRGDAIAGRYDVNAGFEPACDLDDSDAACTIAQFDTSEWKRNLQEHLPSGDGSIVRNNNMVTITVRWNEERTGGPAVQQFSFTTQL